MTMPKKHAAKKPISGPSNLIRNRITVTSATIIATGITNQINRQAATVTMHSITASRAIPMSLSSFISIFSYIYSICRAPERPILHTHIFNLS